MSEMYSMRWLGGMSLLLVAGSAALQWRSPVSWDLFGISLFASLMTLGGCWIILIWNRPPAPSTPEELRSWGWHEAAEKLEREQAST